MAESIEPRDRGRLSTFDRALMGAGVVGGILVLLWLLHAVFGVLLRIFEVAIFVVVVVVIVRLVHLFTRGRS